MKLPNAHLAIVDQRKVVEYLLNRAHPRNSRKCRFFEDLGFSVDTVEPLVPALLLVATTGGVVAFETSPHGEKYVVDGLLWGTLKRAWRGTSERSGSLNAGNIRHGW